MDGIFTLPIHHIIYLEESVLFPKHSFNEKPVSDFAEALKTTCNFVDLVFFRSRVYEEDRTLCNWKFRYLKP